MRLLQTELDKMNQEVTKQREEYMKTIQEEQKSVTYYEEQVIIYIVTFKFFYTYFPVSFGDISIGSPIF